ncbi:transporter substrate-binding domain-containing protein [bacterium]|nr:transporter substrate-binding domain-containing protein [bacterium]
MLRLIALLIWIWLLSCTYAHSSHASNIPTNEVVLKVRVLGETDIGLTETVQWQILDLALQKSGRTYDLAPSTHIRAPRRVAKQLKALGDEGNIIWAIATPEREDTMRAVRIPNLQGLVSYWNFIVREEDVLQFSNVDALDDFKEYSFLLGERWEVTSLMESKGIEVRYGARPNLVKMLSRGRADVSMYPAIFRKTLDRFGAAGLGLAHLPNVILYFPMDPYFFVARDGSDELHEAVSIGLAKAMSDGSYDTLLSTHPYTRDIFNTLPYDYDIVLEFDNPELTEETRRLLKTYRSELPSRLP